jgi:hypothetical protein
VLLTAVHFHFAGFAAPLLAFAVRDALKWRSGDAHGLATTALLGTVCAPAVIAAGFVFSRPVQFAGVLLSGASLILVSALAWQARHAVVERPARVLVMISACSAVPAMALAAFYAAGEVQGELYVSVPGMALWHGLLNGVGFVLCGLLGWSIERSATLHREVQP